MKLDAALLKSRLAVLAAYVNDLAAMLREKGPKHFARPLIMAAAALFVVHRFVYKAPAARLKYVEKELAGAQASSQFAARYKELEERLNAFYATLPNPKDTDNWLLYTVREAMKEEGIEFTQLSPVVQKMQGGFRFVSLTIQCKAGYGQLAAWVARLERSQKLLHISALSMAKDPQEIGVNTVTMTVCTAVPGSGAR